LFREAGIPIVALGTYQPPAATSSIRIDDYAAAYAMTTHLIDLGHRRIGYISGHPRQTASARRLEGYTDALRDAGVSADAALVAQGYFTYHSGLEGADALLALTNRPTAIFAANDDMGAAAIAVAHRLGLDVPRDLTICGFDDTALATTVWPPMTTVRQPVAEMARDAVTLLADAVKRKDAGKPAQPVCEMAPFTLVRRQSDGPPTAPRTRRLAKPKSAAKAL
jgi:LacI family transcriptional regulator